MSLKFRLLSFLSRNTLSRKHDVGILFTWAYYENHFTVAGPRVWNNLPVQPRQDINYSRFKRQLKHFCSELSQPRRFVTLFSAP